MLRLVRVRVRVRVRVSVRARARVTGLGFGSGLGIGSGSGPGIRVRVGARVGARVRGRARVWVRVSSGFGVRVFRLGLGLGFGLGQCSASGLTKEEWCTRPVDPAPGLRWVGRSALVEHVSEHNICVYYIYIERERGKQQKKRGGYTLRGWRLPSRMDTHAWIRHAWIRTHPARALNKTNKQESMPFDLLTFPNTGEEDLRRIHCTPHNTSYLLFAPPLQRVRRCDQERVGFGAGAALTRL